MTADIIRLTPDDIQEAWQEPLPLTVISAGIDYPLDSLPPLLRDAVRECAMAIQAPTSLAACCALSALSLSAQGLANVRRGSGLTGPVSLYVLALASSGLRKSAVDSVLMEAIRRYEREATEAAKPSMISWKSAHDSWASERRGLLDAITLKGRKGEDATETRLKLEEHDFTEPKKPLVPKLLMNDITSPQMVYSLGACWPSSGILSAEAGAVLTGHSMSADEVVKTMAFQNSLWSGESISVDRRASESFTVRGARMTIGIAVQPETIREFMQKNGALARGTGWLARMLIAIPASNQGHRPYKEPPANWPCVTKLNCRLLDLLRLPMPFVDGECELELPVLDFDADAKAHWIEIHDAFEASLAKGGEFAELRDSASKAAENTARIAALFHILEHGPTGLIGAENVTRAGELVAWHLNEALRMITGITITPQALAAQDLDEWLLMRCKQTGNLSITSSEALTRGPHRLRSRAALDGALVDLIEARRVRVGEYGRLRLIHVNPELLGASHDLV